MRIREVQQPVHDVALVDRLQAVEQRLDQLGEQDRNQPVQPPVLIEGRMVGNTVFRGKLSVKFSLLFALFNSSLFTIGLNFLVKSLNKRLLLTLVFSLAQVYVMFLRLKRNMFEIGRREITWREREIINDDALVPEADVRPINRKLMELENLDPSLVVVEYVEKTIKDSFDYHGINVPIPWGYESVEEKYGMVSKELLALYTNDMVHKDPVVFESRAISTTLSGQSVNIDKRAILSNENILTDTQVHGQLIHNAYHTADTKIRMDFRKAS